MTRQKKPRTDRLFRVDPARWAPSLAAFDAWLRTQCSDAHAGWVARFRSKEWETREGAIAEAVVWDYIVPRVDAVSANEDRGTGGVDFRFETPAGPFLAEVTNISLAAASAESSMLPDELHKGGYGFVNTAIRNRVRRTLEQARRVHDLPVVVVVTTLHGNVSRACFERRAVQAAMTSPTGLSADFDPRTGKAGEFYESTDLKRAVFCSPSPLVDADGNPYVAAKYEPISAFILAGFGLPPPYVRMYGGLNPVARIPFSEQYLPDVPLCRFTDWPAREHLAVEWSIPEIVEEGDRVENTRRALNKTPEGREVHEIIRRTNREQQPPEVPQWFLHLQGNA